MCNNDVDRNKEENCIAKVVFLWRDTGTKLKSQWKIHLSDFVIKKVFLCYRETRYCKQGINTESEQ